jgi:hypothetical protein
MTRRDKIVWWAYFWRRMHCYSYVRPEVKTEFVDDMGYCLDRYSLNDSIGYGKYKP